VAKYGAEFSTPNKDTAEPPVAFARNVLRGMFRRTKVNENYRKRVNKEQTQLFGDLSE
jgi:hypothetical protein